MHDMKCTNLLCMLIAQLSQDKISPQNLRFTFSNLLVVVGVFLGSKTSTNKYSVCSKFEVFMLPKESQT